MRARNWRPLRAALLTCIAILLLDAVALSFEPVRAFAVRVLAGSVLSLRGFDVSHADIYVDGHRLTVEHLVVTERPDLPFLNATSIDVAYTLHGLRVESAAIHVLRPRLMVRREPDGTYNLQRLTGGAATASARSSSSSQPMPLLPNGTRISLDLQGGEVDFENPVAPAPAGRHFAIDRLTASARLDPGGVSQGSFSGRIVAITRAAPFRGTFLEDDPSRFAALRAQASDVPLAPLIDLIVSSPAFIVADGTADFALNGYALQWSGSKGPQWHLLGRGAFRNGRIYIAPLVAAARDAHGPLTFNDGILFLPRIAVDAAGLPVAARGSINLTSGPTMSLDISTMGPLERARHLFAFSQSMPLRGRLAVLAAVSGTPTNPLVAVRAAFPGGLAYGGLPLSAATVRLAYFHNHLTFPTIAARYEDITLFGDGDIFVPSNRGAPRGQFVLSLRGPSKSIPWLANIENQGTFSARAALDGPLAQLGGAGFFRLDSPAQSIRSSFSATKDAFAFGPLLADRRRGGSLRLVATMDRGTRQVQGDVVADRFMLALNPSRVALPGVIDRPYGLPSMAATLSGDARVDGQLSAPQFDVGMRIHDASFRNSAVGDLSLAGVGRGGLAWLRVVGDHASVAGIPFKDADLLASVAAQRVRIYGGSADLAGGRVAFMGDVPMGSAERDRDRQVFAVARHIELADLRSIGLPVDVGEVSALGSLRGTAARPRLSLTAELNNAEYGGSPLSGDTHVDYAASKIALGPSRIVLGNGSEVTASGSVDDVSDLQDLARARLDINAATTEADLADLAGPGLPIQGTIDADLHVGGAVISPVLEGTLESAVGSLRGVTYENLGGSIGVRAGVVTLRSGHVVIGNSTIDASGALTPSSAQLALSSPRADLSDFNDFFEGKDVVEGTGALRMALGTSNETPSAWGAAHFSGVSVLDVPLGSVAADIATRQGTVYADLDQNGTLAHTRALTVLTVGAGPTALAQLAHASYRIHAASTDIDVGMLASLLPPEAEGLRGRLSIDATANGPLQRLAAEARFHLDRGFIDKDPINDLSGDIASYGDALRVNAFHLNVSGVDVTLNGIFHRGGTIAAHSVLRANSIATVARLAHLKAPLTGSATLSIDAAGRASSPRIQAVLAAGAGSAYGVQYQRLDVDSSYAPGDVTLRNATVQFPKAAGTIVASGTAPLPYGPQAADPPGQPVAPTPLHLSVRTSGLDLSTFNPLLGSAASLGGKLDFAASARGSLQRPILSGSASVRDATVKTKYETVPLTGLGAALVFDDNSIELRRLHGVLGKGSIDARGVARLAGSARSTGGPGALAYGATLHVSNANVAVPQFFSGVLNSDLSLHSGPPVGKLAGTVALSDSAIPFAGILALASGRPSGPPQAAVVPGVPPLRPDHTVAYAGSIYGPDVQYEQPTPKPTKHTDGPAITPVELDLTASVGRNVQTTGMVNVTGAGSLHIGGTATAPSVSGPIELLRGQVSLFDTTFDLERGRVAFHPRDGFLPTINVAAAAYRPEAEVTVMVSGRVDQLHTDIESDPPMTQEQILANILHIGEINNALSGGGTEQPVNAGSAVEGMVASAATAPLFSALNYGLEQALHIQEVNLAIGDNGSALVELRKQWGRNFYAMFRESLSSPPQQIYGLSYDVRNNLQVDFEQEQNPPGSVGLNGLQPIWRTVVQATAHFDTNRHRRMRVKNQTGSRVTIPQP